MQIYYLLKSIFTFFVMLFHIISDFEGIMINPANGKMEFHWISGNQEVQAGFHSAGFAIHQMGGEWEANPEIWDYVNYVGHKIASVSDRPDLPFDFVIVNDSKPNAMCLPGGIILISTGMLLELQSEAELAAILSHEIGHASARHCARGIERQWLYDLANEIFGSLPRWIGLGKTRKEELEADYLGMEYMARAGYDVKAVLSIAERNKNVDEWEFFKSHPSSLTRFQANSNHTVKLPSGGEWGFEQYQITLKKLREG